MKVSPNSKSSIMGGFVVAEKFCADNEMKTVFVKLSSIISIDTSTEYDSDVNDQGFYEARCVFNTFKDTFYMAHVSANVLRSAINSFMFDQEKHIHEYADPALLYKE